MHESIGSRFSIFCKPLAHPCHLSLSLSFFFSFPVFLLVWLSLCRKHTMKLDTVQGNIPAGGFWRSSLPTIEPEISTTSFTTTYPKRKAVVARLTKYSDVDERIRAAPRGMEQSANLCMIHRKSSVGLCSRSRSHSLDIDCQSLFNLSSSLSFSARSSFLFFVDKSALLLLFFLYVSLSSKGRIEWTLCRNFVCLCLLRFLVRLCLLHLLVCLHLEILHRDSIDVSH